MKYILAVILACLFCFLSGCVDFDSRKTQETSITKTSKTTSLTTKTVASTQVTSEIMSGTAPTLTQTSATAFTTTQITPTTIPTTKTQTTTATGTVRTTKKPPTVAEVLSKESNCTVIVNGKDISSDVFAHYNGDYFLLSLFPIVRELGGKVTWVDTHTALLESDSNTCLLNTSEKTLYRIDEYGELDTRRDFSTIQFNGGTHEYVPKIVQKVLNECIMDNWSTTASLLPLFPGLRVWEDKEMRTITIQYPAD